MKGQPSLFARVRWLVLVSSIAFLKQLSTQAATLPGETLAVQGQRYSQSGASSVSTLSTGGHAVRFYYEPLVQDADGVQADLRFPSGMVELFNSGQLMLDWMMTRNSRSELVSAMGTGNLTFTHTRPTGAEVASIGFGALSIPNAPQISNYSAAQAINSFSDFTIQFNAFSGATANDRILVQIEEDGQVIFASGDPDESCYVAPTATSLVIPAQTLYPGHTYTLRLFFIRLSASASGPGAGETIRSGYFAETQMTIAADMTGAIGGGTGTLAPIITYFYPLSQTVDPGASAVITGIVGGATPMTYQWQKNGVDIAGQNGPTLLLSNVTTANAGDYTLEITNAYGTTVSPVARIVVNTGPIAPTITTGLSTLGLVAGNSVNVSVVATGTAPLTYQWFRGATALSGQTSATLSLSSVTTASTGLYSVRVSNAAGSATKDILNLTVTSSAVGPTIVTQPQSVTLKENEGLTLSVAASGTTPINYQWYKNGSALSGQTSSTLAISPIGLSGAGDYSVTVSNSAGVATSATAHVTVTSAFPPVIVSQPNGGRVYLNGSYTFSVTATSTTSLSYQWRKNGVNLAGKTSSTLSISSAQTSDAGDYTVVVSNSLGSTTSSVARLTVDTSITAPTIVTPPVATTVNEGAPLILTVGASGTPTLTYVWRKNGTSVPGQTNATLSIPAAQLSDAGHYRVTVSNTGGSVTTAAVYVTVVAGSGPPVLTSQPQGASLLVGGSFTLSVTATGASTLNYQWRKGGVNLAGETSSTLTRSSAQTSDSGSYTVVVSNSLGSVTSQTATVSVTSPSAPVLVPPLPQPVTVTEGGTLTLGVTVSGTAPFTYVWRRDGNLIAGQSGPVLSISPVQLSDQGNYRVTVQNAYGSVTTTAVFVTVLPAVAAPVITAQPQGVTVVAGAAFSLSVTASGSGLSYQWYRSGTLLSGETASTFSRASAQSTDGGNYTVVVSNTGGSVTSAVAAVTISGAQAPTLISSPGPTTVAEGGTLTLTAVVSGTAPFTVTWRRDGNLVVGQSNLTLSLPNITAADAGNYRAGISNPYGSVSTPAALVTVTPAAPTITTQPVGTTLTEGGAFTVSVVANGGGTLLYQWLKNGAAISGATSSSYTRTSATPGDSGNYTVVVSNAGGSVTSTAAAVVVNAGVPASIVTAPVGVSVTEGQPITLSVVAEGTAPFSYQWLKGGNAISGGTSSILSIPAAALGDTGSYQVTVSNAFGAVTSTAVSVTVTSAAPVIVPPTISTQPIGATVVVGGTLNLSVVATGSGTLSYQWNKDGVPISGATANTYSHPSAASSDAGSYTVTVSNAGGSVTSSAVTVSVVNGLPPTILSAPSAKTVLAGDTLTLTVVVSGTAPYTVTWRKDGVLVAGQNSLTLSIPNVTSANAGNYRAGISNPYGYVATPAALVTVVAPSSTSVTLDPSALTGGTSTSAILTPLPLQIQTQPTGVTVAEGESIYLHVQATGGAGLQYQWYRDGMPIVGADDPDLWLVQAAATDAGVYTVVVFDSTGSLESNPATVDVIYDEP